MLPPPRLSPAQLAALGLFLALAAWTALSLLWAASPAAAWNEPIALFCNRFGFALASAGLAYAGGRGIVWLCGTAFLGVVVVAMGMVARILTVPNPLSFFRDGRTLSPVTYWNGLACLLMIGFWLALGLTLGRWRRWSVEPLLLAAALALVEFAVLPQSRGAFWAFLLSCPVYILVTPAPIPSPDESGPPGGCGRSRFVVAARGGVSGGTGRDHGFRGYGGSGGFRRS